jgi:hypothetical protein
MAPTCTRCGDEIGADDVRYTRRRPDGDDAHFCSLNCIADTDRFDERDVRARLEEPTAPKG